MRTLRDEDQSDDQLKPLVNLFLALESDSDKESYTSTDTASVNECHSPMVMYPPVVNRLSPPYTSLPLPFEPVPPPSPQLRVEYSVWCDDVLHTVTNGLDTNHTINDLLIRNQTYISTICSFNGNTNSSLPQSTRDQLNHDNMIFHNIILQINIKDILKDYLYRGETSMVQTGNKIVLVNGNLHSTTILPCHLLLCLMCVFLVITFHTLPQVNSRLRYRTIWTQTVMLLIIDHFFCNMRIFHHTL